jgi:hypothetical protein
MEITINYWAVLAAAVANMVVGMLWYGPVFGKQWRHLMGFSVDDMKKMPLSPAQAMLGGFVVALIMAFVLAHDAFVWGNFFGPSVGREVFAFQLAFWIWLGYFLTNTSGAWLWEGRPFKLVVLNASAQLVSLLAMACVLTWWM